MTSRENPSIVKAVNALVPANMRKKVLASYKYQMLEWSDLLASADISEDQQRAMLRRLCTNFITATAGRPHPDRAARLYLARVLTSMKLVSRDAVWDAVQECSCDINDDKAPSA